MSKTYKKTIDASIDECWKSILSLKSASQNEGYNKGNLLLKAKIKQVDQFEPLLFLESQSEPESKSMKIIRLDAMSIGNHLHIVNHLLLKSREQKALGASISIEIVTKLFRAKIINNLSQKKIIIESAKKSIKIHRFAKNNKPRKPNETYSLREVKSVYG